jgi:hypothetical protein
MGKLFQFDDGAPMRFFILSGSLINLTKTIEVRYPAFSLCIPKHLAILEARRRDKQPISRSFFSRRRKRAGKGDGATPRTAGQ